MSEPKKLGPYTLISKIGNGAFGVVWLAEKTTAIATTRYALKVPRDEDIDLEAFKQEAAVWIQASGHPNVVPLIDADIYENRVVIVSEYVPKGSLGKWLRQNGGKAPTVEIAIKMIDGVLAGLEHLHDRNIIHRDLKPDNILLQHNTPRLADFGIARVLRGTSYTANLSGTLAYMAPEALKRKRNARTDIWSVGVIFYEMLAGRLPFDEPDAPSLVAALTLDDVPALPGSIPEPVRCVVMRALERDVEQRYASATLMRADLQEAERMIWLSARELKEQSTLRIPGEALLAKHSGVEGARASAAGMSEIANKATDVVNEAPQSVAPTAKLSETVANLPITRALPPIAPARTTLAGNRPTFGPSDQRVNSVTTSRTARPRMWVIIGIVAFFVLGTGLLWLVLKMQGGTTWRDTDANRAADRENGVAARVNGQPIMQKKVEQLVSQQAGSQSKALSQAEMTTARLRILEDLIQREVLYQQAQRENLNPSDEETSSFINKQKQDSKMTEEDFAYQLAQQHMTMEDLRDEAKKDLAIKKLQDRHANNTQISDREVEEYYTAHQQSFVNARGVGLSMIAVDPADNTSKGILNDARGEVDAKIKIDSIYAQLKAGADFATVARARSEEAEHITDGGDIGFASEEDLRKNSFPQELANQFFGQMGIGSFTEPVNFKTDGFPQGRWYIFKLNSRRLQSEYLTLKSPGVREQIGKELMKQRNDASNAALVTTAMNESKIVNYLALR